MDLITSFDHYATPLGPDGTPYDYFEKIRNEALAAGREIGWSEAHGGFWVTTGWKASREIHQNTVDFSNSAVTFPQYATPSGKPFMLSGQDEPDHTHYRRMVQAPFTKVRAQKMLGQMRDIADMLVDSIIGKEAIDVCEATDPMPGYAFCAIVGLSMDDADKFRRFVHAMVQGATDPDGAAPVMREMEEFWRETVELRRRNPAACWPRRSARLQRRIPEPRATGRPCAAARPIRRRKDRCADNQQRGDGSGTSRADRPAG